MSVLDPISRMNVGTLFLGGAAAGTVSAIAYTQLVAKPNADDHPQLALGVPLLGALLCGGGLIGAMLLEKKYGPIVQRARVDAAESIIPFLKNLQWSKKAMTFGALVCGTGIGFMGSTMSALSMAGPNVPDYVLVTDVNGKTTKVPRSEYREFMLEQR